MSDSKSSEPASDTEPTGPMLGIVCALNLEIAPFLERCRKFRKDSGNGLTYRGCELNGQKICIVEGGTGPKRAAQATRALIDAFTPDWVLSVGFSGGLVDVLNVGDIVFGTAHTNPSGTSQLSVDFQMSSDSQAGVRAGKLCTTDHIVRLVTEKRNLAQNTGAIAVDMESLAVAETCRERKTKFLAVRVVSDDVSTDLPPEILAILGPKGTVRAGALFGSVIKRPKVVKDLWGIRERALKAAGRLADCLETTIPVLMPERAKEDS